MSAETVLARLKAAGYRLTPQRRLIAEMLLATPGPLTVQQVYQAVKPQCPELSLDTVYRTLHLLAQVGVANLIALGGGQRFEASRGHHHHLVCLSCHEVFCLDLCPVDEQVLAVAPGFQVTGHVFDIYGHCASCRAAADGGEDAAATSVGQPAGQPRGEEGGDR